MKTISPFTIQKIGNLIVESAYEQVGKELGVSASSIPDMMVDDEAVYMRVKEYINSSTNYALGKIVHF